MHSEMSAHSTLRPRTHFEVFGPRITPTAKPQISWPQSVHGWRLIGQEYSDLETANDNLFEHEIIECGIEIDSMIVFLVNVLLKSLLSLFCELHF